MKRPTMLIQALLRQAALDLDLSVERDVKTLIHRTKHEGMTFLTVTLPTLSDALERGIEDGLLSCPSSFRRHGSLPCVFKGFFSRVFTLDGKLRQDACPESIYWIRQLTRFFKKLKEPCSPDREVKAIENFLAVEGELRLRTEEVERNDYVLDTISGLIWPQIFLGFDPYGLVCSHGPGVTADRYLSNERNRIRDWDERAEHTFPSDLHCYPNYGYACDGYQGKYSKAGEGINYRSVADELGVRVVFVPKTATAPRVIAIEPAHKQYMQQGMLNYIVKALESHKLTRESLRFSDQRPNQRLAYRSSIDRRLATLDLKDASDRVHLHLVQRIFKKSGILEYLEDSRSLHATLPNGKNIVLWKFASMGSALCFPVEAMVFYTLLQTAMHKQDGRLPTFRSIAAYSRLIDIYGDDLIVPVEYADVVVETLESYALKVNVNKSFRHSLFRESCGADYYDGHWVKPVYARQLAPDSRREWQPEHIMAWVSTANQFYETGKWHIAQAIREMVEDVMGGPIPRCRSNGAGVFFSSFLFTTGLRYNSKLHCWEQRRTVFTPLKRKDDIDGDPIACLNSVFGRDARRAVSGHSTPSRAANADRFWGVEDRYHAASSSGHERVEDPQKLQSVPSSTGTEDSEGIRELGGLLFPNSTLGTLHLQCLDEGIESEVSRFNPCGELSAVARDFSSSTYRGRYKSKCRWTSISY